MDAIDRVAMERVVPLGILQELDRQRARGLTEAQAAAWVVVIEAIPPME